MAEYILKAVLLNVITSKLLIDLFCKSFFLKFSTNIYTMSVNRKFNVWSCWVALLTIIFYASGFLPEGYRYLAVK